MSYIGANSQGIIGVANTDIIDGSTLKNATLDSTVTFPTRTDFGIIETVAAGSPLIGQSSNQDFSYTSGEVYFVYVDVVGGTGVYATEFYKINSNNTVTELRDLTSAITPTISTNGLLNIAVSATSPRSVYGVIIIRMSF